MRPLRSSFVLSLCVATAYLGTACGGTSDGGGVADDKSDGSSSSGGDAAMMIFGNDGSSMFTIHDSGGGTPGPDVNGPMSIEPMNQTIDVTYGQAATAVQFSATINGYSVPASFSIDRGEIGSISASTGSLIPSDTIGGTANISATYGTQRVSTTVTVRIHLVQNGSGSGDAGAGGAAGDAGTGTGNAGGNGGVGGEGIGGPVDPGTQAVLQSGPDGGTMLPSDAGADGAAPNALAWLYPYDQTVWPRGLLAPLLQWNAPQSYDAVFIHLSENAFDYQGFFSATASPFVHHPIPQTAWDVLCNSNQGEKVTVTIVFSAGGQAYGPLTESWTIAQGSLTGTVYYNSYGTNLAHNYTSNGVTFGGATLGIKHGATSPVLVAGNNSECRVCHSVSADGSRLVTTNGSNYAASAWYDLKNGYAESAMTPSDGRFNWGALSPDGTLLFNDGAMVKGSIKLYGSAADNGGPVNAQLFSVATGASYASTGIPPGLVAGSPVFSPDGKHVAFNFYSGTVGGPAIDGGTAGDGGPAIDGGTAGDGGPAIDGSTAGVTVDGGDAGAGLTGDGVSLAVMDYDATSSTFSNFRVVFTPPKGTSVWPSFLPTNDGLVFELETQSNGRDWGGTRAPCDSTACASQSAQGTKAELWWVDLNTKMASRLDTLNGQGYLPTMPATDHTDDAILNYEPTVNPVPSGGYAWVVFTSRRLYGNIATIKPYWSDPRYVDLSSTPTTKKLWVAAVDLNGTPGSDSSHPAFYLPAQELLAGNSRGYWVVDPCEANGASCETGDQCCGGYCENMTCSAQPPACSNLNDKCTMDSDCCGVGQGTTCIDGRCAQPTPVIPAPIVPR